MKTVFQSLFIAALFAGCVAEQPQPAFSSPIQCSTPSPCMSGFLPGCNGTTQPVFIDLEPPPYQGLIQNCPFHLEKEPNEQGHISARLRSHKYPWTLMVWSDSVDIVFPATFFCMDEYTGDYYLYKSAVGDTLNIALYDTAQVSYYLTTQEQLLFVIEVHCDN